MSWKDEGNFNKIPSQKAEKIQDLKSASGVCAARDRSDLEPRLDSLLGWPVKSQKYSGD